MSRREWRVDCKRGEARIKEVCCELIADYSRRISGRQSAGIVYNVHWGIRSVVYNFLQQSKCIRYGMRLSERLWTPIHPYIEVSKFSKFNAAFDGFLRRVLASFSSMVPFAAFVVRRKSYNVVKDKIYSTTFHSKEPVDTLRTCNDKCKSPSNRSDTESDQIPPYKFVEMQLGTSSYQKWTQVHKATFELLKPFKDKDESPSETKSEDDHQSTHKHMYAIKEHKTLGRTFSGQITFSRKAGAAKIRSSLFSFLPVTSSWKRWTTRRTDWPVMRLTTTFNALKALVSGRRINKCQRNRGCSNQLTQFLSLTFLGFKLACDTISMR